MRTFIYLFFLILLIFAGCAPWMAGVLFKRQYLYMTSIVSHDLNYPVYITDYKMGWAHTLIKGEAKAPQEKSASVIFTAEITHGPLVYDPIEKKWRLALALEKHRFYTKSGAEKKIGLTQGFMQQTMVTTFDKNKFAIYAELFPFTYISSSGEKITWTGLAGMITGEIDQHHLKKVNFNMASKGVSVEAFGMLLKIPGFAIRGDLLPSRLSGLLNANYDFTFPTLTLTADNKNLVTIDSFALISQNGLKQNYDFILNLSIKKLSIPRMEIAPIDFKLFITGINADALSQIDTLGPDTPIAEKEKWLAKMITPEAMITSELSAMTPNGKLTVYGEVKWPPGALTGQLEDIYQKKNVRVYLRIPKALAEFIFTETPAMLFVGKAMPTATPNDSPIPALMAQGYLLEKDSDYLMDVVGTAEGIKINGNAYPPLTPTPAPIKDIQLETVRYPIVIQ